MQIFFIIKGELYVETTLCHIESEYSEDAISNKGKIDYQGHLIQIPLHSK